LNYALELNIMKLKVLKEIKVNLSKELDSIIKILRFVDKNNIFKAKLSIL